MALWAGVAGVFSQAAVETKLSPVLDGRAGVFGSVFYSFQIPIEIFVRPHCQKFDAVFIQDSIGQQPQLITQAELVDTNPSKVTHLFLANLRVTRNGFHCLVKLGFLRTM